MPQFGQYKYADYDVHEAWTEEGILVRVQVNSEAEHILRSITTDGVMWLPLHRETAIGLLNGLKAALERYDAMEEDYSSTYQESEYIGTIEDQPVELITEPTIEFEIIRATVFTDRDDDVLDMIGQ